MNTITTRCGVTVVDDDIAGTHVLTACCGAAVTGIDTTRCKGCYERVPTNFGDAAPIAILAAVAIAGCPIPQECTEHTLWEVEQVRGIEYA